MPEESISGVVITFFSTASSVGKTLMSINMASELARQGYKICLMDCDLQFGDVANYLQLGFDNSISDVLKAMSTVQNTDLENLLTHYHYNKISFDVLPAPRDLAEAYNINPEDCNKLVEALRSRYDYIIIDTTSMFSTLNLTLLSASTIVTFLGIVDFIPTIKNMKIGNDTLKTLNFDTNKLRLVLNRSDAKTRIGMSDVETLLGDKFFHVLANDFKAASQSIITGIPLVLSDDDSELVHDIRALVARYTNRSYEDMSQDDSSRKNSGGWFSKIVS